MPLYIAKNVMPYFLLLQQNALFILIVLYLCSKHLVESFHWTISPMFSMATLPLKIAIAPLYKPQEVSTAVHESYYSSYRLDAELHFTLSLLAYSTLQDTNGVFGA